MFDPQHILEYARSLGWELGSLFLFLSSLIEYIFPPFPGDSVTIVGAILSMQAKWPISVVMISTVLGSAVGAALNWQLGRWLKREGTTFLHVWIQKPKIQNKLLGIENKFEKHGSIYIALNRFLPAFRSLFFLGAGYSGLAFSKTIFWAVVSALLFNSVLFAVGSAIGFKLELLISLFQTYSTVVLGGIFLGGLIYMVRRSKPKE